ncbi:MAG: C39 family peptidase [Nanoarchaeota archaeon]
MFKNRGALQEGKQPENPEVKKTKDSTRKKNRSKKALFWLLIIFLIVVGVGPWLYYFLAGESHPLYPIKLSMWTPLEKVPEGFVPPEEIYIENVPYSYIPQEKFYQINYCGVPASAVIAGFYRDNFSLEEIAKEIPAAQGGPAVISGGGTGNIVKFFQKHGYKAKSYGGSERDLKYQLSLGRPVMVMQFRNPSFIIKETNSLSQAGHSLHIRVVIGYKKINGQEYFIVHEGGIPDISTGPASPEPSLMVKTAEPELTKKLNLLIQEQEKLKSTLQNYIKTEDPASINVMAGKDYFIKREDFLAMWQNFIVHPFGLSFMDSPTPLKTNWTILVYKEK